jgi:ABC-2 type transport system permease protein
VLAKVAAMMIAIFLILMVTALAAVATFLAMEEQIGATDITAVNILAIILYAWPVVMVFMILSLFLGAWLPRRRLAAMGVTIYLIVSWIGNNLANISETLERFQPLFPFYYYNGNEILNEGVPAGDLALLLGAMAGLLLLALISFQRRNVTVGAWPWQRAQVP